MLALALAVAVACSDSTMAHADVDADTIDAVSAIDAIDWLDITPASVRLAVVQRDSTLGQLSYRFDARVMNTTLGFNITTPSASLMPTGFWLQHQQEQISLVLGDVALHSGGGLLVGTASSGIRSLSSVKPPASSEPSVRQWRSRWNEPALRGGAIVGHIDSGRYSMGLAAGMSMRDSSMNCVTMFSARLSSVSLGYNMHINESARSVGLGVWMRYAHGLHTLIAELITGRAEPVSMQLSYGLKQQAISVGLAAWSCPPATVNGLGTLVATSSTPSNTWGVAGSIRHTIRSFVGWNIWWTIRGTFTRAHDTPFPQLEYALRAEVRQTVTSQLHVIWRMSVMRDDDGIVIDGTATQQQMHRVGLQTTIERMIRPTLRWRARADLRWLWTNTTHVSSTIQVEVINTPHPELTLRARAVHFACPSYLIASRMIDYASSDLQRLVVCNGYGLRWSIASDWRPHKGLTISAIVSMTTTTDQPLTHYDVRLAVSGQISRAHDTRLPQAESAEQ